MARIRMTVTARRGMYRYNGGNTYTVRDEVARELIEQKVAVLADDEPVPQCRRLDGKVDFVIPITGGQHGGQRRHYVDHMAPTWLLLPEEIRGEFHLSKSLAEYAESKGINPTCHVNEYKMGQQLRRNNRFTMVCGHADPAWLDKTGRTNGIFYHGTGFCFDKARTHPSYPGTKKNRTRTRLMLVPSERIAEIEREANPHIDVQVVGCPKLDAWHTAKKKPKSKPPTIALAWHWSCRVAKQTACAFPDYEPAIKELMEHYTVLGHGHPHVLDQLRPRYEAMGVEVVRDLDEIFRRADLLVADATSAMFEFASLDRPVVIAMSANHEREEDYGGFYNDRLKLGMVANGPDNLLSTVKAALKGSAAVTKSRRAIIAEAYTYRDGKCAERAATAIVNYMASRRDNELHG